jgi:hypothetical protein
MIKLCPESKEVLRKCTQHIIACKNKNLAQALRKSLAENLKFLHTYACDDGTTLDLKRTVCELFDDHAPLSFFFRMKSKGSNGEYGTWFVGGMIFHGAHDNGGDGGAPTFYVCLEPTTGWSIHT